MTYLERQRELHRSDDSLFVFGEGVSSEHRDAVNLTVWAAERHTNRSLGGMEADPAAWLHSCRVVLGNCGWVMKESSRRKVDVTAALESQATDVLLDALGVDSLSAELLSALETLGNWPKRTRWVGVVRAGDDTPLLSTLLLSVSEVSAVPLTRGAEAATSRLQLGVETWSAQLNPAIYDRVRDSLLGKIEQAEPELAEQQSDDQSPGQRIAFINDLDIPPQDLTRGAATGRDRDGATHGAPDTSVDAFVAKSQLVSFVADVPGPARSDVLNSTLLAQEGADNKFDRQARFLQWQRFYFHILSTACWSVQLTASRTPQPGQSVAELSRSMLDSCVSGAEAGRANAILSAAEQRSIPELASVDASMSAGAFQLASCRQEGPRVIMTIVVLHIEADGSVDSILRHQYDGVSKWVAQVHRCSLDLDDFATVRASVQQKLADRMERVVHALRF